MTELALRCTQKPLSVSLNPAQKHLPYIISHFSFVIEKQESGRGLSVSDALATLPDPWTFKVEMGTQF